MDNIFQVAEYTFRAAAMRQVENSYFRLNNNDN